MTQLLQNVVVSKDAFDTGGEDSWKLVCNVVDFVNEMLARGAYRVDEIPARAIQAYWADYYLAQVVNGGHSQFMGNSRSSGTDPEFIQNSALADLRAMGAAGHCETLTEMIAWAEANSSEARKQSGFGNRAATLDALDKRFYAIDNKMPMAEISAAWIRTWPELTVVSECDYADAIEKAKQRNPYREQRFALHRIDILRMRMLAPKMFSFRLAGCACAPDGLCISSIRATNKTANIKGTDRDTYRLDTDQGKKIGIIAEKWTAVFAPPEDNDSDLDKGMVGKLLGGVYTDDINAIAGLLRDAEAAAAVHLLLKNAGVIDAIHDVVLCRRNEKRTGWIAMIGDRSLFIDHSADESRLLDLADGKAVLATVTQADVREYLDLIAQTAG